MRFEACLFVVHHLDSQQGEHRIYERGSHCRRRCRKYAGGFIWRSQRRREGERVEKDHPIETAADSRPLTLIFRLRIKMPATKIPIVKKRTKAFIRHHADRYDRLSRSSWRKPKGIDSCVRRRFKGRPSMPKIGYGSNKKTRHMMPNGYRRLVVSNPRDVDLLLM